MQLGSAVQKPGVLSNSLEDLRRDSENGFHTVISASVRLGIICRFESLKLQVRKSNSLEDLRRDSENGYHTVMCMD